MTSSHRLDAPIGNPDPSGTMGSRVRTTGLVVFGAATLLSACGKVDRSATFDDSRSGGNSPTTGDRAASSTGGNSTAVGSGGAGSLGGAAGSGATGGMAATGGVQGEGGIGGNGATGGFENPAGAGGEVGTGGGGGSEPIGDCESNDDCDDGMMCHPTLGCRVGCQSGPEGWIISSNADLTAFAVLGCEVLEGSLRFESSTLENLDAMEPSPLLAITGDLTFLDNSQLLSISGISGLREVLGSFVINGNDMLVDLAGIETLTRLGSNPATNTLVVYGNAVLVSLEALESLEQLSTSLVIGGNPALESLAGLGGLRTTNSITITNNQALTHWEGLTELEACHQSLVVASNPSLLAMDLPRLSSGESITVTSNEVLGRVELPLLSALGGSLTIAGNAALQKLDLSSLVSVDDSMVITQNPELPQCVVDQIDATVAGECGACTDNDPDGVCD